jgi:hypothetical protein
MSRRFTQKQEEALRMLLEANGAPVSFWKLYDLSGRQAKYNGGYLPGFISAMYRHNESVKKGAHISECASNCPLYGNMRIERDWGPRNGRAYRVVEFKSENVK